VRLSPRWRAPAVPPREALLLLPQLPARAWTPRPASRWLDALQGFGMTVQHGPGPVAASDLVVVDGVRTALATRADLVLLDGRDRTRRLQRAGYEVRTYVAERGTGGAVRLASLGASGSRRRCSSSTMARPRLRQWVVAIVRRCSGRSYVTVAHHGSTTPAAVAAAVGPAPTAVLLAGGGGARRRSTFLVSGADRFPSPAAVKVAPPAGRARGRHEQELLRRLMDLDDLRRAVPRPLGEGSLGPLCWSAESALPGQPLPDVLRHLDAARGRALLDDLVRWFADLGVATRTAPGNWDARESSLPLRGEHLRIAGWRQELAGVPGVLVHGDVGTGGNVLVDHGAVGIIDWETARGVELPLTDLLPLLGLALASAHPAAERAGYVLRLCAGEEPESDWLLASVRSYCGRLDVPLAQAGRLAALAWAYQASMRLVHEELVRAAGEAPSRWTSPAEEVARTWDLHPALGPTWSALTSSRSA
jgi:hypothetical protein